MFKSDRRLWLTDDRESVVEEGDPRARFLLVPEGGEVSADMAKKYGLTDPAAVPAAAEPAEAPAAEEPAAKAQAPAEDKAQHRRSTK